MAFKYSEIRNAVLSYLRDLTPSRNMQISQRFEFLRPLATNSQPLTDEDLEMARTIFFELATEGVTVPGPRAEIGVHSSSGFMSWPFFSITGYGKKVLATKESEPHDPDGYLKTLRARVPTIDGDSLRYLEESLSCFRHGLFLASAVMLGCSSERTILDLVEAFGNAIQDPTKKTKYLKDSENWMISRKYDALWKNLEPLAKSLPDRLGDQLHTILDRVFDLIRTTRNEAGHPTGRIVEREELRANFILFPGYCERVHRLTKYFSANPI